METPDKTMVQLKAFVTRHLKDAMYEALAEQNTTFSAWLRENMALYVREQKANEGRWLMFVPESGIERETDGAAGKYSLNWDMETHQ